MKKNSCKGRHRLPESLNIVLIQISAIAMSMRNQESFPSRKDIKGKRRAPSVIVISDSEDEDAPASTSKGPSNLKRKPSDPKSGAKRSNLASKFTAGKQEQDDAFEADLARAMRESSKQSITNNDPNAAGPSTSPTSKPTPKPVLAGVTSGASLFLQERKKMEAERLARQKRLRPQTAKEESEDTDNEKASSLPSKRVKLSPVPLASTKAPASQAMEVDPLFWDGEIRQTANRHAIPSQDNKPVFRLSEILGSKVSL